MALRIMGPQAASSAAPPETPIPMDAGDMGVTPELPVEEMAPELGAEPSPMDQGKIAPAFAVYRTPDLGPFMCGNCGYFREDGSCVLVAGSIDEAGVCNLFAPAEVDEEALLAEEPAQEPVTEVPAEVNQSVPLI